MIDGCVDISIASMLDYWWAGWLATDETSMVAALVAVDHHYGYADYLVVMSPGWFAWLIVRSTQRGYTLQPMPDLYPQWDRVGGIPLKNFRHTIFCQETCKFSGTTCKLLGRKNKWKFTCKDGNQHHVQVIAYGSCSGHSLWVDRQESTSHQKLSEAGHIRCGDCWVPVCLITMVYWWQLSCPSRKQPQNHLPSLFEFCKRQIYTTQFLKQSFKDM